MTLHFEPISLDRQNDYLEILSRCPQITSDYSFLNLWAWAEEYGLRWAWDGDLIWIRQNLPEELLWAPVGLWDAVDWQSRLSLNANARSFFTRVPEMLTNLWRERLPQEIHIEDERGSWDYFYRVSDLIELKGNRYHKKKNLLNQFNRKYDFSYQSFGADMVEQAMAMQTDWCTWRDCESSDILSSENRAIFRILKEWQYKGIYQAINQKFLANSAANYTFVNREQDLNDEGLRKAKLSYHPEDYLRKFRVTLAATIN